MFSIPGLGILHFEDVGGAVDGNRIDVYVDTDALGAARRYNRQYGNFVNNVYAIIPIGMACPQGSQQVSATEAGF
jgi:hypothetical protein